MATTKKTGSTKRTDKRRSIERKSKSTQRAERRAAGQHEINGAWVQGYTKEALDALKSREGLSSYGEVIDWLVKQVK